jgi:HSP20 family protein
MTLVRWKPRNDLFGLDMLDRFFSPDEFGYPISNSNSNWLPSTDITEDKNGYKVTLELPGLDRENIEVKLEDRILTVKGERKEEKESKESRFHKIERHYGSFVRTFRLPESVKSDKIEAKFKNGLLSIDIPKADEVKPKEIEVKVS